MGDSILRGKKSMTHTLRSYKKNKARLKQVVTELNYIKIATAKMEADPIKASGGTSNPTLMEVEKRGNLLHERDRLFYKVETVDNFLDALTSEQREIVKYRFFEMLRVNDCLIRLDMERHYFYAEIDKIHDLWVDIVDIYNIPTNPK